MPLVQQMGEVINLRGQIVQFRTKDGNIELPAIRTGIKDTETLIQNTQGIAGVGRIVIGIVTLALSKAGFKICEKR